MENVAVQAAPPLSTWTVAFVIDVVDQVARPQTTESETWMPAGTTTVTAWTASTRAEALVAPPSNTPSREVGAGAGAGAGTVVVVVAGGPVVVVVVVVAVGDVVGSGGAGAATCPSGGRRAPVEPSWATTAYARARSLVARCGRRGPRSDTPRVVVRQIVCVRCSTTTRVRGVGAPATTTTASAASTTASDTNPPVGSRRRRIAWRLRRRRNEGPSRPCEPSPQHAGRHAGGGRELGRAEPEDAPRVDEVHIGYARGGRPTERSDERVADRVGARGALGHPRQLDAPRLLCQEAPAHPAAQGAEQIGRGVGAALPGPLLEQLDRLPERVGEEGAGVVGDAGAEAEGARDRDDPREQGLQQAPSQHGVVGDREQRGHDARPLDRREAPAGLEGRDEVTEVGHPRWHDAPSGCPQPRERPSRLRRSTEPPPLLPEGGEDVRRIAMGHREILRKTAPPLVPQDGRSVSARSSVPAVDIEEFYDADERRRESEEIELGSEWRDERGNVYELNYVVDTGELYLMAMPGAELIEDPFGDIAVDPEEPVDELTVELVASVPTVDEVHQALQGWEDEVASPNSVAWLRARLSGYPVP